MDIDFSRIIDSISEGLYVVDRDRRIIYWSRGAERLTGWKAGEVVGSHCSDGILEHEDVAGHKLCHDSFCPLHRSMITEKVQKTATVVSSLSKGGKRIPVEVTTAPLYDTEGVVVGGVEVFRDMSEAVADLHAARTVQLDALSTRLPEVPGIRLEAVYSPRDIVGGDFYRVEQTGERACALFLADVTSHGVSAALSTLLLRSLWDELREDRAVPDAFARRLNERLLPYAAPLGYYAAALSGVLDAAAGTFRFCSMGSPPFIQLSPGGTVTTHSVPGHLLGVERGLEFEAFSIPVHSGDRLLFVTDGAFEAAGEDGLPYGVGRVAERFRHLDEHEDFTEFCAALQRDLLARANLMRLPDDFTAILAAVL
jgi:phosphoserine phosphatase RsbU/P